MKSRTYICIFLIPLMILSTSWTRRHKKRKSLLSKIEIGAGPEIQIPMGELGWVYKPAIGYKLYGSKIKELGRHNNYFIRSIGLGYTNFESKEEKYYFLVDKNLFGTAEFIKYSIFEIDYSMMYAKNAYFLSDNLQAALGIDVAWVFVKEKNSVSVPSSDNIIGTDSGLDKLTMKGLLAPRLLFKYDLGSGFGASAGVKFNLYFAMGSSDPNREDYNKDFGTYNYFLSNSVSMYFQF